MVKHNWWSIIEIKEAQILHQSFNHQGCLWFLVQQELDRYITPNPPKSSTPICLFLLLPLSRFTIPDENWLYLLTFQICDYCISRRLEEVVSRFPRSTIPKEYFALSKTISAKSSLQLASHWWMNRRERCAMHDRCNSHHCRNGWRCLNRCAFWACGVASWSLKCHIATVITGYCDNRILW